MSSPAFEAFLARLYTDAELRHRFLASPAEVTTQESALSDQERRAVEAIDRDGLILAADSYARKRGRKSDAESSRTRSSPNARQRASRLLLLLVVTACRLASARRAARARAGSN